MKSHLLILFLGYINYVSTLQFNFNSNEVKAIIDMQDAFRADSGKKGFIGNKQVLGPQGFLFLEGVFRFDLEFNNIDVNNPVVPAKIQTFIKDLFREVVTVNNRDEFFSNIVANVANTNFQNGAQQDTQLALASALLVNQADIPHGPNVFCIQANQCVGNRDDDKVTRSCNNLGVGDGVVASCDNFVAFFTLRWLLFFIVCTYIILALWALYFAFPVVKKNFYKGYEALDSNKRKTRLLTNSYNQQEQVIINTLAMQCASAENLLFQASDMMKQAQSYKNILATEVKVQTKIMIHTVEYFQACCAIMVSLTHQYLTYKTFTPGERFEIEDATTRALQLEVLAYIRDRLQLAFNAETPEKSFLRLGEAYAIMKKITDGVVLVGFEYDQTVTGALGELRTPTVSLTEDAFFLSGIFQANQNTPGAERYHNRPVAITVAGASNRNIDSISASYFLGNRQKDSKIYDPMLQMTQHGIGKALVFNIINGAQDGDTLQNFARSMWGREIAPMQEESKTWGTGDGSDLFLDRERLEREQKAAPLLRKNRNRTRNRRRRRDRNTDVTYSEENDGALDLTMGRSEWALDDGNTYVFNVKSVVAQGMGIAGKPGMPYDKARQAVGNEGNQWFIWFQKYFPNYAEWPKFYTLVFVVIPFLIAVPMIARVHKGSTAIDKDGNVAFKARAAGFGTSFLGVPAYYFLDGFVPLAEDLVGQGDTAFGLTNQNIINNILAEIENNDPFNTGVTGKVFISNAQAAQMFEKDFNGAFGRLPDTSIAEIQAGILSQANNDQLLSIRKQQERQEVVTVFIYAFMHNAGYFFGLIPITLVRESLEIIARRIPFVREIYPMSLWRELHMSMGLAGIFCVVIGATFFLLCLLTAIGKSTPFAGLAGDPNIASFFDLEANVLYLRQLLLPAVPLLLLMKYASRGPPKLMQKYAPTWMTLNYWEICYFLHYFTALTAIIMLVLYRPQVFYWMGATWGFVWGGNKIVRILRTRQATLNSAHLVSYTVLDERNNAKKASNVLRVTLNVPHSFPLSARGQACWVTAPHIDYIAHPFTLAKVPTSTDKTIMFHIAVRYLPGDDVLSGARPAEPSAKPKAPMPGVIPTEANALPPGWKTAVDPQSGQTYYYNTTDQKTTWTFPRPNVADALFEGFRGMTTRFSAAVLGSARFGNVQSLGNTLYGPNSKSFKLSERPTWTQKFANFCYQMETMDPDLRKNQSKIFPIYISAPLGTSMDDAIKPSLPGSIIITTQNGLPAAESCVRWLLTQPKTSRPAFHFFVSVSREINDALAVMEMLRNGLCEAVSLGTINVDGINELAHVMDWLGIYIHLTRRKPTQIGGDRELLMMALKPPTVKIPEDQLRIIDNFLKGRIQPGRLPFDRFLTRVQQMVKKRTGEDNMAVGYCGSAQVAYSIRAVCQRLHRVSFDGEFI